MTTLNKQMKNLLKTNGIIATPKFITKGSLRGTWRIYNPKISWFENNELHQKMTSLGFSDFDGKPLDKFSGNGGLFSVFARFDKTNNLINQSI